MSGFLDPENLRRVVHGVRNVERMMSQEAEVPHNPPTAHGPVSCSVLITDDQITSETPPFDEGLSEQGYWPGKFMIRNQDHESPGDEWVTADDDSFDCLVYDVSNEDLEVDRQYSGQVVGMRNMKPIVQVQASAAAGGSVTSDEVALSGTYSVTADNTWEDTGLSLSLPSAGTYHIYGTAVITLVVTTASNSVHQMLARLWNVTGGAAIARTLGAVGVGVYTAPITIGTAGTIPFAVKVVAAGAMTIRLEALVTYSGSAPTWGQRDVAGTHTHIGYLKF